MAGAQTLEEILAANPFAATQVVDGAASAPVDASPAGGPQERREALLKRAAVPRRYATKVRPNHRYDDLLDAGDGLYIVGQRGCGKTHMAWEVALGYLERHMHSNGYTHTFSRSVRVITANDLFEEVKATFDGEGSASAVLNRYATCDLLVLDDLGKEVPTPWVRSKLFQLVNKRYNDCKATIVTSQYDLERFTSRMGRGGGEDDAAAIRSRLIEMCTQVVMRGGDRRLGLSPSSPKQEPQEPDGKGAAR